MAKLSKVQIELIFLEIKHLKTAIYYADLHHSQGVMKFATKFHHYLIVFLMAKSVLM
jgi:hypothetical protein